MKTDLTRLNARLSTSDRRLLDQHLTLVREQEARLLMESTVPFSCSAGTGTIPALDIDADYWPTRARHHVDTIVGALRCDATRVATLAFGVDGENAPHTWA